MTTIAYIGNFGPRHSSENHVARAFTTNGHTVYPLQENNVQSWTILRDWGRNGRWPSPRPEPDFVLRTRTWELPEFNADQTLEALRDRGIPTVGYHLDRWWGLPREKEVAAQSFFRCDLVITADGGHDDQWAAAGVNHLWLPPGVSRKECLRVPAPRTDLDGKVVFVGSWQGYHPEWPWRMQLIDWLRTTYGDRFVAIPAPGEHAVRGQPLRDVYAADAVFVGDSCLTGGAKRYWSDRVPESLGRGGYLIHPHVDGIDGHYTEGTHFDSFTLFDFDSLGAAIDRGLADGGRRRTVADAGRSHVLGHHTYETRVEQIIAAVNTMVGGQS